MVLLGPTLPTAEIEELAARVPVVAVARALRTHVVDVVRTDDKSGGRLAVDHLVALGHQRIAHVDGLRAPGAAERRRGYREAMADHGLARHTRLLPGGVGEESGTRAGRSLLRRGAPTAVTVFNDACAAGLLATVRSGGLEVPGGLSVVGYDDSSIARLPGVALTTVAQDAPALAAAVVDLALRRSAEPGGPATEVVVPPHVVVRRTTASPA
jgi:DNA-binding LacI/PurR family transcriptional regulator